MAEPPGREDERTTTEKPPLFIPTHGYGFAYDDSQRFEDARDCIIKGRGCTRRSIGVMPAVGVN